MSGYYLHTDQELMALIKAGDRMAFTELYDRHSATVCRFVLTYLKSPELSEDICQNTFLKLWEQRDRKEVVLEPLAYVLTIAKRQSLDFLKRAAVDQYAMSIILQSYPVSFSTLADYRQQDDEYERFLSDVLQRLPEKTQAVFKLCRQEAKSYDEAAKLLGISRNAVKKHMVRSMKVLKDAARNELGIPLCMLLYLLR